MIYARMSRCVRAMKLFGLGSGTGTTHAPSNVTPPVVTGTALQGQTLTCSTGIWTGTPTPTFTYQWVNSHTGNIGGATSSTYTLASGDVGYNITCVVTGTNVYGNANATSNSVGPIAIVAPTVSSATVASNGTTFTVVFSESVNVTSSAGITFHDVTQSTTPTVTYTSGSGSSTIIFTLSGSAVSGGDTLTWDYASGTGNIVASGSGNTPLASFSAASVTNNTSSGASVRSGSPTTGTITASSSIPLPTLVAGDLLLVFFYSTSSIGLPTTPTGWTLAKQQIDGGNGNPLGLYTKTAAGGDTFNFGSSGIGCYAAYAVVNGSFDAAPTPGSGTSTPISSPSVTTTQANDLVFSSFAASAVSSPTISTPSGGITATSPITLASNALVVGYETVAGIGATTARTAAVTGQTGWAGITYAAK